MARGLNLTGIEELLESLSKKADQAQSIVDEGLIEAAKIVEPDMKRRASQTSKKLANAIHTTKIEDDGNKRVIKVGIDTKRNPEAFYARYWEFGFRGRDGKGYARPYVWPAYEKNKRKVVKVIGEVVRRRLSD